MRGRFLAIDPSTTTMGLVVFSNGRPVDVETVIAPGKITLARINHMINAIALYLDDINEVACETWGGAHNPQGQTLIKAIQQTAAACEKPCYLYNSGSVVSAVIPRGFPRRTTSDRKRAMRVGVLARFPFVHEAFASQDEYDAAAVGICHLIAMETKAMLDRYQIN